MRSSPVDGFRIAYDREGAGRPVVLLDGWPGDRADYREVTPLLSGSAGVVVPDLRGLGESDKHAEHPARAYSAEAQARSVLGLIDELGLQAPVIAGYDVGSRVAQTIARTSPDLVRAIVVSPPPPGVGDRVLSADAQREFWYQAFHQPDLAEEIIDGNRAAVRAYLRHFWSHWSGPAFHQADADLDRPRGRLRGTGRIRRIDRLVPRRLGDGRHEPRRDPARAGRPNRRPRHHPLAGARPALSSELG